jgi:hypothetical protein
MAHQGYGEIIIMKENVKVTIPQKAIKKNGKIKQKVMAKLNDLDTENALELFEKYGVTCESEHDASA